MNDGSFQLLSLESAVHLANDEEDPHVSVMLPIKHDGDPSVYLWSISEGQNIMWTRSDQQRTRGVMAVAMAIRAHAALEELAEANPEVEVDPYPEDVP